MANAAVEAMLASRLSFTVAAAGCGKTELLGQLVADQRSGRQLVLTHTHAGVAAIRERLARLRIPHDKFHLDTIAGWCLRYGVAYPRISGIQSDVEGREIDWKTLAPRVYAGAEKVCNSALGKRVLLASYDGVLVDEYQDCSEKQHSVVRAISRQLPCRGVGDPLQTVFDFREDPVVSWKVVKTDFHVLEETLTQPWRWRREGRSAALGEWLVVARKQLEEAGRLVIAKDAPITWVQHNSTVEPQHAWATCCQRLNSLSSETVVAILKWPPKCIDLAKRMGGRWSVVERFDNADLFELGASLANSNGPNVVELLMEFVSRRMTGVGAALRTAVNGIKAGRGVSRIMKNRDHAYRLSVLATTPTPTNALAWLEGVLAHRGDWRLYRNECVYQLREALRHCTGNTFAELPDQVAAARTRARHRGRLTNRRTIGTPLLVKGLEFDHAVLLWEPDHLSAQGLYVALTRASKSLTIVSRSRTLEPAT